MTPTTETWRPIPDWEGYYEASDHGRIRSVERMVYAGGGRTRRNPSKVLAPQSNGRADDRRTVHLSRDGQVSSQRIAPLVLTAFVGPRPKGLECCHANGDEMDDRLENLRWDTRSGNLSDAVRHGTNPSTRKTRCPRGHALVAPNLTASCLAIGRRQCLACNRAHSNAKYARRRGRPFDFQSVADAHYAQIMEEHGVQQAVRS